MPNELIYIRSIDWWADPVGIVNHWRTKNITRTGDKTAEGYRATRLQCTTSRRAIRVAA